MKSPSTEIKQTMEAKGMTSKKNAFKRMLSLLCAVALIITCLPLYAFAAEGYTYEGGAGNKVSDLDTSMKYGESLGDNASTEYAGRVWSDKSVFTGNATFDVFGGGKSTILLNTAKNGEDFLISYSVLATAQSVSAAAQAPVDVMIIIDISGSMSNADSNMDNGKSRIYNTVVAANNAIEEIMALNEYTRVGVVAFSNTAEVLLPLDRYTKITETEREWVQTGNRPGQGYWDEREVTQPYFSLNRETASNNNATLYTKAKGEENGTVNRSTAVSGGTNIQVGLYQCMKVLAEEQKVTTVINGKQVKRVPSIILLSDGFPTYSSSSSSWWAPAANNNDGPGSAAYAGNGMKAILVASYMKDAIDRNYGVTNTAYATTIYTIGMGINELENSDEKNLAYMTLNPGKYWNDDTVNNSMKTAIKNYWQAYTANNNTGTVSINVGRQDGMRYYDDYYTLTHPNTGYDVNPTNGYDYADDYYDADNASAVLSVFKEIVANIAITSPQVPTEIKGSDPIKDGYLTYTDPLGEYMEVKDVKAIIYAGQTFTAKSVTVNGNVTSYTFSGSVHSAVYGDQELENVIITVTEENGKQTLVVKIPASVIPLRLNEVTLNADGSVMTHVNNGAMPARIIYSVGLQSEVTKKAANGTVYIDKTKLDGEYLNANTNDDGTVNFYSNLYNSPHLINGYTVGNTTVEFEPSHSNGFYYILEDMPIYKDAEFKNQVTAEEGIDDNTVYYYRDEYYHGNTVEVAAIERTGAQLKRTEIKTVTADGESYLYRAAGSPRLNRILKFEGTKLYNVTDTAEDFYAPEFHYAEGSQSAYDGKFIVHLGNNGVLTAVGGGDLKITKTVLSGEGLTAPDTAFEFTVTLDGTDHEYAIFDASGAKIGEGTVNANNNKIYLKDGESATVYSILPSTAYTVAETAAEGFRTSSVGESGTIEAGVTKIAAFTNSYGITTPVSWPTNGTLNGTKVLSGREWSSNDSFKFIISPYNNAPLPANYNADNGVTVNAPDVAGGSSATFDFGTIEFTAPGVYRYTVFEEEPAESEFLPGMSYSRALYRIEVIVEDNGNGTLSVASYDIQRLYDDGANPLFSYGNDNEIVMNGGEEAMDEIVFVNTYLASSVTRVPVAIKNYIDKSGNNPLVSGMFEFKLEAKGVVENGELVENSVSRVPMPEGSVNGVIITTNEGHNVTFPHITFSQDILAANNASSVTFRYEMSEVIPQNPVNGMKYDERVYTVDVVVSIDPASNVLSVVPTYPTSNGGNTAVFENVYTPKSVTTDINGIKTLLGRDMKSGEIFSFLLQNSDASGNVIVPAGADTATVINGKDGVASAFAFEDIEFLKAGSYEFTVSEVAGSDTAISYDNSVITVTVVVDDTDNDGNLEVTSVSYNNGKSAAEFTNVYTSRFSGEPVTLEGIKNLTGKTLLAGEFYFAVEVKENGDTVDSYWTTHTGDSVAENGVYSGTFSVIDGKTYENAGIYEYYISEVIPEDKVGGTTYDETVYRFTVTVEDDLNGNLTATSKKLEKKTENGWIDAVKAEFNNSYEPDATTATLPLINKVIDGDRSEYLTEGEFEFEIGVESATSPDGVILPANKIAANAANGNVIFGDITFTKAGSYVISVKEIEPDEADKVAGITYSKQVITAVYNVVDDRNGNLTATLTQLIGGDNIVNYYKAESAEVTVEIEKNFTGRENNEWLITDSFEFQIKITDTETLAALERGDIELVLDAASTDTASFTIAAKGESKSTVVKINKIGTYKLTVTEVKGDIDGVSYDETEHEIVIVVTDNSKEAKLKTEINGQAGDRVTVEFNNEYSAEKTEPVTIGATKKVTMISGSVYTFVGGEFSFVIEGSEGAPMPDVTTVTNDVNGRITFGSVEFTKAGVYTYTVYEVQGNNEQITYDRSVYTVEITVTDNGRGKLEAADPVITKSGVQGTVDEIVFENIINKPATPPTGDASGFALWLTVMLISGAALISVVAYGKKKNNA